MTNSSTTSPPPSDARDSSDVTRPQRLLLGVIGTYQRLRAGRVSPCRFYPSCSEYAAEAIAVHGAWRGSGLALRRVGRCRPLGPHGVDLVPLARERRSS
ncbi:MAG: membrane protein insertion efficiency factor YidD [Acidobacteriota bacterium]|nr:membrane protein insertion efficiency factor YidD [Acidobacteriota bacterium]